MRDPCQADLVRAPGVRLSGGWVWSRSNPPDEVPDNRPGKWMLFPRCADAVAVWQAVASAAADGRVWLAKISPQASRNGHLVCVYTPDFTDLGTVESAARLLDDLGLTQRTIYYKPDVFTYAGVYRRGASIYAYDPSRRSVQTTPGYRHALELL